MNEAEIKRFVYKEVGEAIRKKWKGDAFMNMARMADTKIVIPKEWVERLLAGLSPEQEGK